MPQDAVKDSPKLHCFCSRRNGAHLGIDWGPSIVANPTMASFTLRDNVWRAEAKASKVLDLAKGKKMDH